MLHHPHKKYNRLEERQFLGVDHNAQLEYGAGPNEEEDFLKFLRRGLKHISLRKLAAEAGISYQQLSEIVNGKACPRKQTRNKLLRAITLSLIQK
jgi:hypothetical protein